MDSLTDMLNRHRGMEVTIKRLRGKVDVRGVVVKAGASRIQLVDLRDGYSTVHVAIADVEFIFAPRRRLMA